MVSGDASASKKVMGSDHKHKIYFVLQNANFRQDVIIVAILDSDLRHIAHILDRM